MRKVGLTRFRSPERHRNRVLLGDAGNDMIDGGLGRDLLLGGLGADALRGGRAKTCSSGTIPPPTAISEWDRTDLDYGARAQHLHVMPGGLNGDVYLNPFRVADAAALDQLYGESDLDLFFTTSSGPSADRVNDAAGGAWMIPLS